MTIKQAPFDIEQQYTFYSDFQIADQIGGKAGVLDTYKRVQDWQDNAQAWGEVVCALNWRLWDLYESDESTARLYQELWQKAQAIGYEHGDKDEKYASIFFRVTD